MVQEELDTQIIAGCSRHAFKQESDLRHEPYSPYYANGGYADIYKESVRGTPVAVKVWRGASLCKRSRREFMKRLVLELDKWGRATHPNIVPYLGLVGGHGSLPALVLPFYKQGHVMRYLSRNPQADILRLLIGLADAIKFLHGSNPPIVHGDIKGSNVLISDDGEALLTDIGIGSIPCPQDWTVANRDDSRWMAPEVIDPGPEFMYDTETDFSTPQSDVYSFGMTALEMYSGKLPFAHRKFFGAVVFDVMHGVRPPRPSNPQLLDDVWILMQTCWHQDPMERPSMAAVAPWLRLLSQI